MARNVDICDRTFDYALRAINLYSHLQNAKDRAGWVLGDQYLRAATSIGANVEEAQAAESRADFIHKMNIAQKEARESHYWLRLLLRSNRIPANQLQPLLDETNEILAILTSIVTNTKRRRRP
jgi:four helix bundle protein